MKIVVFIVIKVEQHISETSNILFPNTAILDTGPFSTKPQIFSISTGSVIVKLTCLPINNFQFCDLLSISFLDIKLKAVVTY
jgi:hypothetical protein